MNTPQWAIAFATTGPRPADQAVGRQLIAPLLRPILEDPSPGAPSPIGKRTATIRIKPC
jgi:hypothetical protein